MTYHIEVGVKVERIGYAAQVGVGRIVDVTAEKIQVDWGTRQTWLKRAAQGKHWVVVDDAAEVTA